MRMKSRRTGEGKIWIALEMGDAVSLKTAQSDLKKVADGDRSTSEGLVSQGRGWTSEHEEVGVEASDSDRIMRRGSRCKSVG